MMYPKNRNTLSACSYQRPFGSFLEGGENAGAVDSALVFQWDLLESAFTTRRVWFAGG